MKYLIIGLLNLGYFIPFGYIVYGLAFFFGPFWPIRILINEKVPGSPGYGPLLLVFLGVAIGCFGYAWFQGSIKWAIMPYAFWACILVVVLIQAVVFFGLSMIGDKSKADKIFAESPKDFVCDADHFLTVKDHSTLTIIEVITKGSITSPVGIGFINEDGELTLDAGPNEKNALGRLSWDYINNCKNKDGKNVLEVYKLSAESKSRINNQK